MTFNVLAEEKSNAIEIQTPKDLKKYKKKLRIEKKKCKNKEKIRNIEQAIEDYEAKKCEPKIIQKPVKTKPSKSNESDQMLEKEFQKNKKFHQKKDDFEKSIQQAHEQGFQFYQKQEWDKAIEKFDEVIKIRGGADVAAQLIKDRCISMKSNPPPAGWDGCEVLNQKHF